MIPSACLLVTSALRRQVCIAGSLLHLAGDKASESSVKATILWLACVCVCVWVRICVCVHVRSYVLAYPLITLPVVFCLHLSLEAFE